MFKDREEAARRLADALDMYRDRPGLTVLAIPRGAAVIGAVVADALGASLDLVGVKKIGAPGNPEFAVGAIDEDGTVMTNPGASVTSDYVGTEAVRLRSLIVERLARYRGGRSAAPLENRTVIIVDDGVATGLTALAAVDFARRRGASEVVVAAPVMAPDAHLRLQESADAVVSLSTPPGFMAVGQFYEHFPQVDDDEVEAILTAASTTVPTATEGP